MEVSHICTSLNHHWCVYTGLVSRIGKKDNTENYPRLWGNLSPKFAEIAALCFGQFLLVCFFSKSAGQLFYFHSAHLSFPWLRFFLSNFTYRCQHSGYELNMNHERNVTLWYTFHGWWKIIVQGTIALSENCRCWDVWALWVLLPLYIKSYKVLQISFS